ncbi:hypothetical protein N4R57_14535 [Rhodobacteraceae bacterium D3-12]|nr:hypothetical protein N4R57_14535 [Rhodobacteraceae bacterium D3-12]
MTRLLLRTGLIAALAAPLAGCGVDGEPVTPTARNQSGINMTISGDVAVGVVNGQVAYGSLGRSVGQNSGAYSGQARGRAGW